MSKSTTNNNGQLLIVFGVLLFSISFIVFGFVDFLEYKEYPHICLMSELPGNDDEMFEKVELRLEVAKPYFGYELFRYKTSQHNENQNPNNNNNNKNKIEDSVYFIHGNSGDYGESRWLFAEFSKIFFAKNQQQQEHQQTASSSKFQLPDHLDLFSFSFLEEANIHSGEIVKRQASFVADQILSVSSHSRCVWLVSHSMGGVVARIAAERLARSSRVDICGIYVLASPQSKLPLHIDSTISRITEQFQFWDDESKNEQEEEEEGEEKHESTKKVQEDEIETNLFEKFAQFFIKNFIPKSWLRRVGSETSRLSPRKITGIIVSATNGAGDIQVYENSMSDLNERVKSEALVAVDVSTQQLAGLSTSHHGITYCHQLVRPLMKSLVWLMSEKRIVETLKSAKQFSATTSKSSKNKNNEPEKAREIETVLETVFFSTQTLLREKDDEADVDPSSKQVLSPLDWLPQISTETTSSKIMHKNRLFEGANFHRGDEIIVNYHQQTVILSASLPFEKSDQDDEEGAATSLFSSPNLVNSPFFKPVFSPASTDESEYSAPPQTIALPWKTGVHDEFKLVRENEQFAFVKAVTFVQQPERTVRQLVHAERKKTLKNKVGSNVVDPAKAAKVRAQLSKEQMDKIKTQWRASKQKKIDEAKELVLRQSDNTLQHSIVIPDIRSRVFYQNTNISASSAFWIRIGLASPNKNNQRDDKNTNRRRLLPTVAARCGNNKNNNVRFFIPLNGSEVLPSPFSATEDLQNYPHLHEIDSKLQFSWMWMPSVGKTQTFSASSSMCELILLSSEPLCANSFESDEKGKSETKKNECWLTSVTPAPLHLRALHAARHCNAAYELIFSTCVTMIAVLWILNYFLLPSTTQNGTNESSTRTILGSGLLIVAITWLNIIRRSYNEQNLCADKYTFGLITLEVLCGAVALLGASLILVALFQIIGFYLAAKFFPRFWFTSPHIRRISVAVTLFLCCLFPSLSPILVIVASEFIGKAHLATTPLIPTTGDTKGHIITTTTNNIDNIFVRHAQQIAKTFALNSNYVRMISVLAMCCFLPNMVFTLRNVFVTKNLLAQSFIIANDLSSILLAIFLVISCLCFNRSASCPFTSAAAINNNNKDAAKGSVGGLRIAICVIVAISVGEPLVSCFDVSQLRFLLVWCGAVNSLLIRDFKHVFVL